MAAALGLVAASLVSIAIDPTPAAADSNGVIVVDTTSDRRDPNPADGVCQTSRNNCSLRAAIQTANARVGSDVINFAISGSGTKTISPGNDLPTIYDSTGSLLIDGYTQGDARPNTAQTGSNARIRIQIQGDGDYGLRISSAENTLRGLSVAGFDTNVAIHYEQADGNVISGNFLGFDAAGNGVSGSNTGLQIWLGPDQNLVGGPALADRNVISGNRLRGVLVEQGATSRNTIQNNVVGLNPSLTGRLTQGTGLDMQWGTWGNLVGGVNPGEGNLFSGNQVESDASRGGIDLSHQAAGNLVIGNFIGTLGDGDSGTSFSANTHGLMIKDDAKTNYIADNVIANSRFEGIKHQHNYNGPSTYVNNRIGVGSNGAALGNGRYGVRLNGHDDLFDGNIIANNVAGGVRVVDEYVDNSHSNHPPEQTLRNVLRYNTFYRNGGATPIDITPVGLNGNDQGDGDDGPHRLLNSPVITGLGSGQVYGRACVGCEVQVSVSGRRRGDGTINPLSANAGVGAAWVGSVIADGSGRFSLASEAIRDGKRVSTIAIDGPGNTSEMSSQVVPSVPFGIEGNPSASLPRSPAPGIPSLPPPYVSQFPGPFDCSHQNGRLSWTDVGASEYYVFAVTDGNERYLGPQTGSSVVVADADSYRVTQWKFGRAISATCDFSQPVGFSCSVAGGVLSWSDAGALQYFVFATTGGVDRYLGGHAGTTLSVASADSYQVTHWLGAGPTRARCEGDNPAPFACSVAGGVLSWSDAGASQYFVFATTGGVDRYLGGHTGTTLSVAPADSYRVTYWTAGSPTRATCP